MTTMRLSDGFSGDFGNLWDSTEAAGDLPSGPIPAGAYECRVLSGETFEARSGTPGYKITFEVCDGEHAGRRLWLDLWLSRNALPYTKRDLLKLGIERPDQLREPVPPGIIVNVRVAVRESDGGVKYNAVRAFDVLRVEQPEPDPFAPADDGRPGETHTQGDDAGDDDGVEEFEL